MKKIGIAADSTCDLPEELKQKYDISILPLVVIMGEKEYRDGVDIHLEELFAWSDEHETTPKTSAIPPGEIEEFFKEKMQEYEELFFFTIGAKLSSTFSTAQIVAEELELEDRIHVIDSDNLSTGISQLIIEAAVMAQNGESSEAIIKEMERLKPLVRSSFVVDTLTYLHRGGRCSGMIALVGGSLKIHPCIDVIDGTLQVTKKYRGKMDKVLKNYISDRLPELAHAKPDRVFITNVKTDEKVVKSLVAQIEEMNYFKEIHVATAGSVIASHCGPGTLGILYLDKG